MSVSRRPAGDPHSALKLPRRPADHDKMRRPSQARRASKVLLTAIAAVTVVAACAGCAGNRSARSRLAVITVSERDFKIKAPRVIRAGNLRLHLENKGPDTHELIIARLGNGPLPLRSDGLTVDEDALKTPGTLEGLESGRSEDARLHLPPGRYVLFCNMAGHYLSGMHATVIAR
jgi:uncharacterized cupredoxin-like copper-binding protein